MILLYTQTVIWLLIGGNNQYCLLNSNLAQETQWTWVGSNLLISNLKTKIYLINEINQSDAIDVKMDGSVHDEKSSFETVGLSFSFELDFASYVVYIAKTASMNNAMLIHSVNVLFCEAALYLYAYTIRHCIEYCNHVWADTPSYYQDMFGKLQKWICRIVCLTFNASLGTLSYFCH